MAGALAFSKASNDVDAIVNSPSVLKSSGDMDIVATISQEHQLNSESAAEKPDKEGKSAAESVEFSKVLAEEHDMLPQLSVLVPRRRRS